MTHDPDAPQAAPSAPQSAETPATGPMRPDAPSCAVYARSSAGTPAGPGPQAAAARARARALGWQVTAEYTERRTGRPGPVLDLLLAAAGAGGFDRVVVAELGALGRAAGDGMPSLERLADAGLTLATADQVWGPAELRLAAGMLAAMAELDAGRAAEILDAEARQVLERTGWGPPDDDSQDPGHGRTGK